jgi:3-oxoadipate enol-lactonase
MSFLETRGVRLHYLFERNQDRPTLVLANSLGTNLSMWDAQVARFREHFSLLRFDMRGHGLSSIPSASFGIADTALDVIALLDHLHVHEASFCGLSMGGMIGQWLAAHASDRFRCFVLCNTAAKIGTDDSWNQRIDLVMSKGMQAIVPSILERWYTPRFRESSPEIVERTAEMLLKADPRGYALGCGAIRDIDFRELVGTIHSPTLVVYGTEDPTTPASDAQYLAEKITNACTLALKAAHLSNIEATDTFSQGVLRFLLHCQGEQSHG